MDGLPGHISSVLACQHMEIAVDIGLEDGLHRVRVKLGDILTHMLLGRIVDEDVDLAESGNGALGDRSAKRGITDISGDYQRLAALCFNKLTGLSASSSSSR